MDAVGANSPEPDDDTVFDDIVRDLRGELGTAAVAAEPDTPPRTAVSHEQVSVPSFAPKPSEAVVVPPEAVVVLPPPQQIKPPEKPPVEHFRYERALTVGYWMSVGVGVVGQVASFGALIAESLPAEWGWKVLAYAAAGLGAAFAEVTMVGSGTAALRRRYDGGTWRLLAAIACIVCGYATVLNILHWAPISIGLAVMFGGGSLVGFSAHTVAEHMAAGDYERKLVEYRAAIAKLEARQAEQDKPPAERHQAPAEQERQAVPPENAPDEVAATETTVELPKITAAQPGPAKTPIKAGTKKGADKISREEVLDWAVRQPDPPTSGDVLAHFKHTGRPLPTDRAVRNWLAEVKS